MNRLIVLILIIILSVSIWHCSEKIKPVEAGELTSYTDAYNHFTISYPSNWYVAQKQTEKWFLVVTSKQGMRRFAGYDTKGLPAAKIELLTQSLNDTVTINNVYKKFMKFQGDTYSDFEDIMIDGVKGKKTFYSFELEDGNFHGDMYVAAADSGIATIIVFETFSDTYDMYKPTFDKIIKTVKLARTPTPLTDSTRIIEQPQPSETLRMVSGDGWTMGIPDNFSKEGGYFMGKRRADCLLKVIAKTVPDKTNFGKSVEKTRAAIKGSSIKNIKLGSLDAKMFTYKPKREISGEMYFVKKGNKLYQITINWWNKEAEFNKPIFQKCVKTFTVK